MLAHEKSKTFNRSDDDVILPKCSSAFVLNIMILWMSHLTPNLRKKNWTCDTKLDNN